MEAIAVSIAIVMLALLMGLFVAILLPEAIKVGIQNWRQLSDFLKEGEDDETDKA